MIGKKILCANGNLTSTVNKDLNATFNSVKMTKKALKANSGGSDSVSGSHIVKKGDFVEVIISSPELSVFGLNDGNIHQCHGNIEILQNSTKKIFPSKSHPEVFGNYPNGDSTWTISFRKVFTNLNKNDLMTIHVTLNAVNSPGISCNLNALNVIVKELQ